MPKRSSKPETDSTAASNSPPSDETAESTKPSTLNPHKDVEEPGIEIVSPASVENGSDKECARLRAVLNANIGACHMKLVSQLFLAYHKWDNSNYSTSFLREIIRLSLKRVHKVGRLIDFQGFYGMRSIRFYSTIR